MTTKRAIEILKKQREKIDDPNVPNDQSWVLQTSGYVRTFFGESSSQYSFISKFTFNISFSSADSAEFLSFLVTQKPIIAKQFIDDCIETLNNLGIDKSTKTNFLQRLDNSIIWTIISVAVPGILGIGFLFGQFITDTKNYDLKQEIKQLHDSLFIIKSSISTIPTTDSSSNQKRDNQKAPHTIAK